MMQKYSPHSLLKSVFGHAEFRLQQLEIIEAAVQNQDILALMPSGAGKSLCYQLPALMRGGLTVVISPLIALMRDQVYSLRERGVKAAMINSANDDEEDRLVFAGLQSGQLKLLYMSPERFAKDGTFALLERADVTCIVVDEAHCIAHWGKEFRPEYLSLGSLVAELAASTPQGQIQIMAVTATADSVTQAEIIKHLFAAPPKIFTQSFDRPNIHLKMIRRRDADTQILSFIKKYKTETGIIYCSRRRHAEAMAELLNKKGYRALAYHAGLPDQSRSRVEKIFQSGEIIIIVATIAFGMGVDRADVRFVCHADTPSSIETYYQEIGRAGRDGQPAFTLGLFDPASFINLRQRIKLNNEDEITKKTEALRLKNLVKLCKPHQCRRVALLAHFEEKKQSCRNCDWCEGGVFKRFALRFGL
jgi:ATP-dependent DNA helicase RecQ